MSDFGKGYFCLHTESAGELRAYSSSSRGAVHVLKVEVQFASAMEMGDAVDELGKLQASIKAVRSRASKPKAKPLQIEDLR